MRSEVFSKKIGRKIYYGWMIILVSGFSLFFSAPGQTYSISTFINYYIQEFQYSRTLISTIYSVATICSGLLIVFVGKAVDRYGQRTMTIVVTIALAFTCLFNSFISNITVLALGFFFLRYFGQGSLTLIPSSLIPQWFDKKRAFAISLANLGGALANMLVPLMNVLIITTFSWRIAWRFWSVLLFLGFLPLAWLMIINKPEDIGLLPDNKTVESEEDLKLNLELMAKTSWQLSEAIKTKEFWFVGLISMIVPMISTGMMFHFFSIMSLKGLNDKESAFVIGLVALPGFIMPLVSNFIIDKYRSKQILSITLAIIALDLFLLIAVNSLWTAAVFMLIYGLAINMQGVTIGVIWPRYFGRKYLGSIRGAATVFMVIGSALGPLPFGLSFDLTSKYSPVILIMAVITGLSIMMSLSIKKPEKSHLQ